jgi:hypothetical protein
METGKTGTYLPSKQEYSILRKMRLFLHESVDPKVSDLSFLVLLEEFY